MNRRAPGLGLLLMIALTLPAASAFAADTVYYYSSDTVHSEVVITDANRNVVERTYYAPYGQVLNRDLRDGPGYTGHEEDPETGLVYMQQRYYDPETGQFLSVDPVGVDATSGGNFNRYEYAKDNPYRYTDPTGMCTGTHICKDGLAVSTGGYTTGINGAMQGMELERAQLARRAPLTPVSAAPASAHTEPNQSSTASENHVATPLKSLNFKLWKFKQELSSGNIAVVDSRGGIVIQAGGVAGPLPTDQFGYWVTQRPLNANETPAGFNAPIDWGNPVWHSSGLVGDGGGPLMRLSAPVSGPGGNRWFINFPSQESAHGNADNEYLDIYVPRHQ